MTAASGGRWGLPVRGRHIWSSPSIVDLDATARWISSSAPTAICTSCPASRFPMAACCVRSAATGPATCPASRFVRRRDLFVTGHRRHPRQWTAAAIAVSSGRCWDLASCAPVQPVTKQFLAYTATGQPLPNWPRPTPAEASRTASPRAGQVFGNDRSRLDHQHHAQRRRLRCRPCVPAQRFRVAGLARAAEHSGRLLRQFTPLRHDGIARVANLLGDTDPEIVLQLRPTSS